MRPVAETEVTSEEDRAKIDDCLEYKRFKNHSEAEEIVPRNEYPSTLTKGFFAILVSSKEALMRFKINIMSWIVFLGLLIHMADGKRPANKYIIAKRTDHPVKWIGI